MRTNWLGIYLFFVSYMGGVSNAWQDLLLLFHNASPLYALKGKHSFRFLSQMEILGDKLEGFDASPTYSENKKKRCDCFACYSASIRVPKRALYMCWRAWRSVVRQLIVGKTETINLTSNYGWDFVSYWLGFSDRRQKAFLRRQQYKRSNTIAVWMYGINQHTYLYIRLLRQNAGSCDSHECCMQYLLDCHIPGSYSINSIMRGIYSIKSIILTAMNNSGSRGRFTVVAYWPP